MRSVIQPQLKFGETDIAAIVLDPKSRDDIPQLLRKRLADPHRQTLLVMI